MKAGKKLVGTSSESAIEGALDPEMSPAAAKAKPHFRFLFGN
jgi:hypothetical protein